MDLIPVNQYIDSGIWIIRIIPEVSVVGRYDMWLPGNQSINTFTGFLKPDPEITLTIPSATDKAISVGVYDTSTGKVATFSGRGFTRENNQIKPDMSCTGGKHKVGGYRWWNNSFKRNINGNTFCNRQCCFNDGMGNSKRQ